MFCFVFLYFEFLLNYCNDLPANLFDSTFPLNLLAYAMRLIFVKHCRSSEIFALYCHWNYTSLLFEGLSWFGRAIALCLNPHSSSRTPASSFNAGSSHEYPIDFCAFLTLFGMFVPLYPIFHSFSSLLKCNLKFT